MKEPLYLLDGYALIYRSYFAFLKNPLYNAEGKNTSAVFGFFRTLLSLWKDKRPRYFAVVLDSRVPTFRHAMFPEYKATRQKTPEDLHAQVPVVEEILKALGIPVLVMDGYEADDLIATLAERSRNQGRDCYIISGDKDLLQLVEDTVRMIKPDKGSYKELGKQEVLDEWGVNADQIVDYLALTGDSSDNVPGVEGIGPKTAAKLLQDFKTLDGVYEHLDSISSKSQKQKLADNKAAAYLSKDLVTLKRDVPLVLQEEDLRVSRLNVRNALPLFLKQGIKSLSEDLSALADGAGELPFDGEEQEIRIDVEEPPQVRGAYECVVTQEALDAWIRKVKKATLFSFDVETDGIDAVRANPVGFSLSVGGKEACYIPLKAKGIRCLDEALVKERLGTILADKKLKLIGQNCKFDYKVTKRWGIDIRNMWFDTMIAGWLLDSGTGTYNMDYLAEQYLGYKTIHYKDVVAKGETFDQVAWEQATEYAAEDADITFRLYEVFHGKLKEKELEKLFFEIEMPLVEVLSDMELRGIRILPEVLKEYGRELSKELNRIEFDIYKLCGREFNINSTKQLQEILFTERKLRPVKKTKTGYSTDTDVLEELAAEDPVPEKVLQHRMLSKLKSTYVDSLPELINPATGRIHTQLVQTGTATGRLSSRDPNLQNIPIKDEEGRRIRSAFAPEEGCVFLSADYSQIELVVLAHLSGDENLIEAFKEGKDIHRRTGALIFGVAEDEVTPEQRRIAKTINFGVMYGMSAFRLSRELGIPRAKADGFIKAYFETYRGIDAFIEKTIREAEETGYVKTLFGRIRPVETINSKNKTEKMAAERIAVNTPIQGTAADIVKLAMLRIREALVRKKLSSRLLLQVHDELIFEVPQEETEIMKPLVRSVMESVVKLSVPLRVNIETGNTWGDMH